MNNELVDVMRSLVVVFTNERVSVCLHESVFVLSSLIIVEIRIRVPHAQ
jgi:hypothetical protein